MANTSTDPVAKRRPPPGGSRCGSAWGCDGLRVGITLDCSCDGPLWAKAIRNASGDSCAVTSVAEPTMPQQCEPAKAGAVPRSSCTNCASLTDGASRSGKRGAMNGKVTLLVMAKESEKRSATVTDKMLKLADIAHKPIRDHPTSAGRRDPNREETQRIGQVRFRVDDPAGDRSQFRV